MNIICEGPDASGKTTLAKWLAKELGYSYNPSEGPCKSIDDFRRSCDLLLRSKNAVFDRHRIVSEPVYGQFRDCGAFTDADALARVYASKPLIIFCVPQPLDRHVADSATDTPEYLEWLLDNHNRISDAYKTWARDHADVEYRLGDPPGIILAAIMAIESDQHESHSAENLALR